MPGCRRAALRYACLAALLLGANVALLEELKSLTGSLVAAKLLTETVLFTISFIVQRALIFTSAPRGAAAPTAGNATSGSVASAPLENRSASR